MLNRIKFTSYIFRTYQPVLGFIGLALLISIALLTISWVLAESNRNFTSKDRRYECGFDPFNDSRQHFEIQFYLVAILFLVFDLERIFIYPWVLRLRNIGLFSFWAMRDFLLELIVGLAYSWLIGALELK